MPVVANHARRLMWRTARSLAMRVLPALIMLAVFCITLGKIWLGLAAHEFVELPKRGSMAYELLVALDSSPDASVATDAFSAAIRAAANDDRAGQIFRIEHAQRLTTRALSEQPMQPRLWLSRVALLQRAGSGDTQIAQSMKMAYFTSQATGTIVAERLHEAAQLKKLDDRELADLIRADVMMLLLQRETNQSSVMPAEILAAYREGSAAGRALLVGIVADTRPDLLSSLQ
jgi:hypothetical protein